MKTKLKKGFTVELTIGADKGKSGEIIKMFPREYKALVKGINVKKKHQKPTKEQKGGIVTIEKPVHLSNLKLIDGKKSEKKADTKKVEAKKTEKKTEKKVVATKKKTATKAKKTVTKKKVKK